MEGIQGITEEEFYNAVQRWMEVEEPPTWEDGWFTARKLADVSNISYERIRRKVGILVKDDKLIRKQIGREVFYKPKEGNILDVLKED